MFSRSENLIKTGPRWFVLLFKEQCILWKSVAILTADILTSKVSFRRIVLDVDYIKIEYVRRYMI